MDYSVEYYELSQLFAPGKHLDLSTPMSLARLAEIAAIEFPGEALVDLVLLTTGYDAGGYLHMGRRAR